MRQGEKDSPHKTYHPDSTFKFQLKAERHTSDLKPDFPSMSGQTEMNHQTVLVVEDHEDTRLLLKVILERKGYRVVEAEDGLEAIGIAACEHPGLVLMDVRLPTLDGLAAIRHLRGQKSLRSLPIVVISAHAAPRDHINAMAAGCNAYLTKPIDFSQLNKLLHHYVPVHESAT